MRYTPDRNGVRNYLLHDPELKAELRRRAGLGLAHAATRARRRTGALRASGRVQDAGRGGVKGDRMELQVVFDDDAAAPNQFGNRRMRGNGFLTDAIPIIERG